MKLLRELDEVAYVRFASVYRSFRDIDEFRSELDKMALGRGAAGRGPMSAEAAERPVVAPVDDEARPASGLPTRGG